MILLRSAFECDPHGHGGKKRSTQIAAILAQYGVTYIRLEDPGTIEGSRLASLKTACFLKKQLNIPYKKHQLIIRMGRDTLPYQRFFESQRPGIFLWESSTRQDYQLPLLAKASGMKVVALPHNLESLVPDQHSKVSGRPSPDWFNEELDVLSKCDHVVTISREEQWLLRLHGIEAEYMPYYPPHDVELALRSVRQHREQLHVKEKLKKFLLLGTFGNPPTRRGMTELVKFFGRQMEREELTHELHVVGYGTERLSQYLDIPEGVIVHGGVSQDELESILEHADGMISHQPATTGSLTRVPEMLVAGVPMLLNANSARSWHGWPGVYVYETFDELFNLMSIELQEPTYPERPEVHESRFIKKISDLHGEG